MRKYYLFIIIFLLISNTLLLSQNDQIIWRKPLRHIGVVNTAIFSPDEKTIINGAGKYVQLRDTTRELINNFDGGDAIITALAISPDGEFIYSGAGDDNNPDFVPLIIKWNIKTGELDNVYEIPNANNFDLVESIDVSSDNKYLIASFRSKQKEIIYRIIALWNIETTELIKTSEQDEAKVPTYVKFSSDLKSIVVNVGKTIEKFSIPSLESLGKYGQSEQQHSVDVRGYDFSDDGEKIVTVAFDGFIKLWDYKSGELLSSYQPNSNKKDFFKVKLVDNAQSVFVAEEESPNLELYSLKYKRKFTTYKSVLSDIKDFTVTKDFQKILVADSSSLILLKSNYYLVNEVQDKKSQNLSLSVLPNPIINKGIINYSINSNAFVNIQLFNTQGISVYKLVDKYQNKGKYQIELVGNNLSSGIYFLVLKVNNIKKLLRVLIMQ